MSTSRSSGGSDVPEFRRAVIPEGAQVTWKRRADRSSTDVQPRVWLEARDKTAVSTAPPLLSLSLGLHQLADLHDELCDLIVGAEDRAVAPPVGGARMPALAGPKKVTIPAGVEVRWTADLAGGGVRVEEHPTDTTNPLLSRGFLVSSQVTSG